LLLPNEKHEHTASSVESVEIIHDDINVLKDSNRRLELAFHVRSRDITSTCKLNVCKETESLESENVKITAESNFYVKGITHLKFLPEKPTVKKKNMRR
jgi:hypothetical protein